MGWAGIGAENRAREDLYSAVNACLGVIFWGVSARAHVHTPLLYLENG